MEPTTIHFVKGISKKINLAPTSVRNHIQALLKEGLVKRKKSKPFNGFVGNRESREFILHKRAYNLCSLKALTDFLVSSCYPGLAVVYGSYSFGEDVEGSDIDILVISKVRKEFDLKDFEKKLKRDIHPLLIGGLDELDERMKKKVWNGIVLYGGF